MSEISHKPSMRRSMYPATHRAAATGLKSGVVVDPGLKTGDVVGPKNSIDVDANAGDEGVATFGKCSGLIFLYIMEYDNIHGDLTTFHIPKSGESWHNNHPELTPMNDSDCPM